MKYFLKISIYILLLATISAARAYAQGQQSFLEQVSISNANLSSAELTCLNKTSNISFISQARLVSVTNIEDFVSNGVLNLKLTNDSLYSARIARIDYEDSGNFSMSVRNQEGTKYASFVCMGGKLMGMIQDDFDFYMIYPLK